MTGPIDLTGQKFGRLVALSLDASNPASRGRAWICKCDCGGQITAFRSNLTCGHTTTCGCLRRTANGRWKSPEHNSWVNMRTRCHNPKNAAYRYYGGRGIKVCERWNAFTNFLADMGAKPSAAHSLDRIENDGDYEPGNCKWATRSEQQRNKRAHGRSGMTGITFNTERGKWKVYITIGTFDSLEAAMDARKNVEAYVLQMSNGVSL